MKVFSLAFILFLNPFLFGRVFWGSDLITLFVFFVCVGYLLITVSSFEKKVSAVKFCFFSAMFFYYMSTSLIRFWVGQSGGDLIFHMYQFISLAILFTVKLDFDNVELIIKSILISLLFHVWTIIPFLPLNDFLLVRLSSLTAYGTGEYSIAGITRRSTGFFNSPGYLSLYSCSTLALGVFLFLRKKSKISLGIISLSCIAGFSSFSRTFAIVFILVVLYLLFFSKTANKIIIASLITVLSVYISSTEAFKEYNSFVGERLSKISDFSNNDRISGETGMLLTIKAIGSAPWSGSATSINGGDIKSTYKNRVVRPHFGLLAIVSFYGVLIASTLVIPQVLFLFKSVKIFFFQSRYSISDQNAKPFIAAFLSGFLVCFVEPLSDSNILMNFMAISFFLMFRRY